MSENTKDIVKLVACGAVIGLYFVGSVIMLKGYDKISNSIRNCCKREKRKALWMSQVNGGTGLKKEEP